jgi:hypothetical protein
VEFRSYTWDQRLKPFAVFTSCTVTRMRSFSRRTVASTTTATSSNLPIWRASRLLPFNEKDDVRDTTWNSVMRERALISSSASPSLK